MYVILDIMNLITYISQMLNGLFIGFLRFKCWLEWKLQWLDPLPSYPWQTGAPGAEYDRFRKAKAVPMLAMAIGIPLGITDRSPYSPLDTIISIAGLCLVGFALGIIILAYSRYMSHWDELQQRIALVSSAIALATTTLVFFLNAAASYLHLMHLSVGYIAFVPIVMYWFSIIAVRARFGLLKAVDTV